MMEGSHDQTSEMNPRQKWRNEKKKFQIHKTIIEVYNIFSIEGVPKVLKGPMRAFRVQLIYNLQGLEEFGIKK